MMALYSASRATIRQKPVFFQFSNRDEIKTNPAAQHNQTQGQAPPSQALHTPAAAVAFPLLSSSAHASAADAITTTISPISNTAYSSAGSKVDSKADVLVHTEYEHKTPPSSNNTQHKQAHARAPMHAPTANGTTHHQPSSPVITSSSAAGHMHNGDLKSETVHAVACLRVFYLLM